MSKKRWPWHRPYRELAPLLWAVSGIFIVGLIFLGEVCYVVVLIVGLPIFYLRFLYSRRRKLAWSHTRRITRTEFNRAHALVQEQLRRAGISYRLERLDTYWFEIIQRPIYAIILDNGLSIGLKKELQNWVYIGPVNEATRRDVEWFKGMMDEVLD